MTEVNIKEALGMRSGIDVTGKISGIEPKRTINLRTGGTLDVADATLEDASGSIKLTLWGEDISKVKQGSTVTIFNGYTNEFKGKVSLTKGKYGTMEVIP